ncbi:hypothetical protein FAVG1_02765 [Fusarium avenaceum]|nr:hypothetical protein FAVG1_02765 [Fusarium avenaceum]
MSWNPDQTQEVLDNSLPALSTVQEEPEDVPLHYEQGNDFINSGGDHRLTTSPSRGSGSGSVPLTIEDSAYSSDEAKTTSRKRKRSHSMLSSPNDESSEYNVILRGYVDCGTTMSDAPLDNLLPPITPDLKEVEQRMIGYMKDLKKLHSKKNIILNAINFHTSAFIPTCLQEIQERRNAASERTNEPTVEVSPAKQQALGQNTNSKQEEFDSLVLLEKDIQKADRRVRTLETQASKYDTQIRDCQERIDNEGYPTQVVILRRNLDRLRTANLVLLSPKEIEELDVLLGRFPVEEQGEGWA